MSNSSSPNNPAPLVSARDITKRYGAVVALADANLDVQRGEVLALVGANGSGKSTLSKIINGVVTLDRGSLQFDGRPVRFASPAAARRMGIATVFQELSLVPQMSVAENIWLTREPLRTGVFVDQRDIRRRTEQLLALFEGTWSSPITPDTPVGPLPPDEKQLVEILKAVSSEPRLLILDEATASLDRRQVQRLFELVTGWKQAGMAIVMISHRMEEIFQMADRYTVLRNGATVGSGLIKDATAADLVNLMVGGATAQRVAQRERATPADMQSREIVLAAENLHAAGLHGVSFALHRGELLGLGGLRGQGQRQLLLTLFGDSAPSAGTITVNGARQHFSHPRQAMRAGLALVPGERAAEGLLTIRSILENLLLPSWRAYGRPLRIGAARGDAAGIAERLHVKAAGLDAPVSSLSGGNAQKIVIGKWLLRDAHIVMLDDPTKGIDVGAKAEFYTLLARLCNEGKSVLLYSSDDEELIGLCDRVLVMHDGMIRSELAGDTLTRAQLVAASLGSAPEDGTP